MLSKPLNTNFFGKKKNLQPKTHERSELLSEKFPQDEGTGLPDPQMEAKPPKQPEKSPNEYLDELRILIRGLPRDKQRISFGLIGLSKYCRNVFKREAIRTPADILPLSNADMERL